MSSTPDQAFSNLNETKDYLNIAHSNADSNPKIQTARNAADNYTATQIRLHATIPLRFFTRRLLSLNKFVVPVNVLFVRLWIKVSKTNVSSPISNGRLRTRLAAKFTLDEIVNVLSFCESLIDIEFNLLMSNHFHQHW